MNGTSFGNLISCKIFEVAIITPSFCFAGIMCHCIVLRTLSTCCIKATVFIRVTSFTCGFWF